jgi:hypothetical protein
VDKTTYESDFPGWKSSRHPVAERIVHLVVPLLKVVLVDNQVFACRRGIVHCHLKYFRFSFAWSSFAKHVCLFVYFTQMSLKLKKLSFKFSKKFSYLA